VSDQPKTLAETTQGARNRAQRAAAAAGGSNPFGIGMESGLFESEGRLFDVCACAIYDGQEMHIGYSCAWELPPAVQEKVLKEGMDLTQVRPHDFARSSAPCCTLPLSRLNMTVRAGLQRVQGLQRPEHW
jgi:non-canonical (house-cleaning) NTP pyrophosphatase